MNKLRSVKFVMLLFFGITAPGLLVPLSPVMKNCSKQYIVLKGDTLYAAVVPSDNKEGEKTKHFPGQKSCIIEGALIRVMLITLIVWFGISIYLFLLSRRISSLEKKLDEI